MKMVIEDIRDATFRQTERERERGTERLKTVSKRRGADETKWFSFHPI